MLRLVYSGEDWVFLGPMKLWLLSFILLFLVAEGIDWLGTAGWLGSLDLSLPMTVLGGLGLAIASNTAITSNTKYTAPLPPSCEKTEVSNPEPPCPPPLVTKAPAPRKATKSISFEIRKPFRPHN